MSEQQDVRVHFASGRSVDTQLEVPDEATDVEVEEHVEALIKGEMSEPNHGKPRWTWIGDLYIYTQTVEAVEIL